MKKAPIIISILLLAVMFITPVSASADSAAGIKPGSVFYFFDTAFEKIGLFFVFGPEKKAKKALEYAEERLAEAEESANENKPKAVEKAMKDYEKKILFATEKSKELKDEKKAEELLNKVSENAARHQEVLEGVLEKVPDEAKDAIRKAIEMSKKGREEAIKQIKELKKENRELKKQIQELKEELKEREGGKEEDEHEDEENEHEDEDEDGDDDGIFKKLKKEIDELELKLKYRETERDEEDEDEESISLSDEKEVIINETAKRNFRDAVRVSTVKQLQIALMLYFDANNSYPVSLSALTPTYMSKVPVDPLGNMYYYIAFPNECKGNKTNKCDNYHLGVNLEMQDNSYLNRDADADSTSMPGGISGSDSKTCRPIGGGYDKIRYCYDVVGSSPLRVGSVPSSDGVVVVGVTNPYPLDGKYDTQYPIENLALQWNDNLSQYSSSCAPASGYDLYLSHLSDPTKKTVFGADLRGDQKSINVNNVVKHNQVYYWRVDVRDACGNVLWGPVWSFVTGGPPAPSQPTNLRAQILQSGGVKLTWIDNSDNEDGFKIERKEENGSYKFISAVGLAEFTDIGLAESIRYYYRVSAYNRGGDSNFSNEVGITNN